MTIQQFIEKAIEGGWIFNVWFPMDDWKFNARKSVIDFWRIIPEDKIPDRLKKHAPSDWPKQRGSIPLQTILLDPLAWQAVGRVEGWRMRDEEDIFNGGYLEEDEWLTKMHRMIDALAQGRSLEQYLETL